MNEFTDLQEALKREIHFHNQLRNVLHQKRSAILGRDMALLMESSALIDTLVLEAENLKSHREALVKAAGRLNNYNGLLLSELISALDPIAANALGKLHQELIHIFEDNQRLCEQNSFLSHRLLQVAADLLQIFTPGNRMQVYTPHGLLTRYQAPQSSQLEILA